MIKTSEGKEFVESIRALDENLEKLKLNKIEINVEARRITYVFICDKVLEDEVKDKVLNYLNEHTLPSFKTVEATFKKVVSDREVIERFIHKYVSENYASLSYDFTEKDVVVSEISNIVKFEITLTESGKEYFEANGVMKQIVEALDGEFCDEFSGTVKIKSDKEAVTLKPNVIYQNSLDTVDYRYYDLEEVKSIDGGTGNTAMYIEDSFGLEGELTLAGKITDVREKEGKNGNPFYIIYVNDTTGTASGIYFPKKNSEEKFKALKAGDAIIFSCKATIKEGRQNLFINKINSCKFPEKFEYVEKKGKGEPLNYSIVFPEPMAETFEVDLFYREEVLPDYIYNNEFVVFDLETTGTSVLSDEITEIGAVKLVNGKVKEKFYTYVKPDNPIPKVITSLTGIDDETVKDAPKIADVMPDFYKFTRGAILVAHNAAFDVGFIRRIGKGEGYYFNNEVIDTYLMSTELLPQLKNRKLDTIADYFNIKFVHHRAFNDAFATSKIFIKLYKMKNNV